MQSHRVGEGDFNEKEQNGTHRRTFRCNPIEWEKVILTATYCTSLTHYIMKTATGGGKKVPTGNLWGVLKNLVDALIFMLYPRLRRHG